MAGQMLESKLKEARSRRGLSDSIRVQQLADPVDLTQEASERDVAVQMLDRESVLVRQLRAAIDRTKDGSYGICLQCEEEIAPRRLQAIPWAELCIQCQQRADNLASEGADISAFEDRIKAA